MISSRFVRMLPVVVSGRVAAVALGALGAIGVAFAAGAPTIDPAKITEHVKVLASDAYEGRGPATAAEKKTVDYIVGQFKSMGLKPAGDAQGAGGRAWTQDVPLMRSEVTGPMRIEVKAGKDTLSWKQSEQVVIRATQTGADHAALDSVPIVFVGYGVNAPERKWDDFKDVDVRGKLMLVLVNDPDFEIKEGEPGAGDFGGKAMTYYGRWSYKFEEAARRHAAGVLVIHEAGPASYEWATPANSDSQPMFDVVRANPLEQHTAVEGWIHRDATVDLFKRAGLDFEALRAKARTREFKPVTLTGETFSTQFAVKAEKVVSKNVVAMVAGKGHPDERIIYTAHWDHLGIGRPDAKGDKIYNGAVDNAAGVSQVLEIARAFAKGPQPDRTVLFLLVTAEEKGLLGSEYYASNPLYPLATTVADLNTDAPRPIGPTKDFATAGSAALTLQDDLIALGRTQGRSFTPDNMPGAGRFFRSDHFPFAKRGVPAISFKSGSDLVDGGSSAGDAWEKEYTRSKYHQPADQFDASWRSDGMAADATLLYDLGKQLANSRSWPLWKDGSEFKAARDATAGERR